MIDPRPADGSPGARTIAFFEELARDTMHRVDEFYAEDVRFEDPMVVIDGRGGLRDYYESIYRNDPDLRWEFVDLVADADAVALAWVMHLRVRGLNGGDTVSVPGCSRLRFDATERCTFHRDYFDMGAFVYEQLPVLRNVVRFVKRRLHGSQFEPS